MTSKDKLHARTLATAVALSILTPVAIYFSYGSDLFHRWPWMRFSIVVSVLTCLWAYAFNFDREPPAESRSLLFMICVLPVNVLLMYPGAESLGIWSDSRAGILLFILAILHGAGFAFVNSSIVEHLSRHQCRPSSAHSVDS